MEVLITVLHLIHVENVKETATKILTVREILFVFIAVKAMLDHLDVVVYQTLGMTTVQNQTYFLVDLITVLHLIHVENVKETVMKILTVRVIFYVIIAMQAMLDHLDVVVYQTIGMIIVLTRPVET